MLLVAVSSALALASAQALAQAPLPQAASKRPVKKQNLRRFTGRVQVLSGAAFALPQDPTGERHFTAYVPLDIEIGLRVSGPLGLVFGGVGYTAPFDVASCGPAFGRRASALGSFLGLRLDFNNRVDGSWVSPFVALRGGVVGQDGVATANTTGGCTEQVVITPFFAPRVGLDIWMGRAAATFALGYDVLPRASALTAQVGLTLRVF